MEEPIRLIQKMDNKRKKNPKMNTQQNEDIDFPTPTWVQKKLWIRLWLVIVIAVASMCFAIFGEWTCPACKGMKMVQEVKECSTCRGTGEKTIKCENCKGTGETGRFISSKCEKCKGNKTVKVTCDMCKGKGKQHRPIPCKSCEGTGKMTVRKWIMN